MNFGRSSSQSSFNSTYSEPGSAPYPIAGAHMQAIMLALTLFIVRSMQPLSLVEDELFRTFIKTIDPRITLPCRSTLTKTILPELRRSKKQIARVVVSSRWYSSDNGLLDFVDDGQLHYCNCALHQRR